MAEWYEYLRGARRLWDAAEAADGSRHVDQAVGKAIHAVIAANDAFCLFALGRRPAGEAHGEPAKALQRACRGTQWEGESLRRSRQLSPILEHETAAQYHGKPMEAEVAAKVLKQAKRFPEWVDEVLPPLGITNGSS